MIAIKFWNNLQNDFIIKYMANNKQQNKPNEKQFTITFYIQISYRIQRMLSYKNSSLTNTHNKLKIKYFLILFFLLLSYI